MKLYEFGFFLLPALLAAQEYRGTILGRVVDPSGAAVAEAVIRVTNEETNVRSDTASNEAGNYQIPFLLPGNYTVTVERQGFRPVVQPGVRVSINAQVKLDFLLEIGGLAEAVTVRDSPPLLNTAGADLGQVISNNYVNGIAVALTRNIVAAARLAPGVTGKIGTYSSNDQSEFSVSGGGSTQGRNEYMVDGIPSTVPQGGGNLVFVPSIDSVEEVKVHTTMFDASYGHSNGGAVSITTRGGTNEWHGGAYDFKRWRALDANSWVNNRLGLPRPPVNYNQWGLTLGGPVFVPRLYNGRNRTFFFVALEQDKINNAVSRQSRVPTERERSGDFSQTSNRLGGAFGIFDPETTVVAANRATRAPFPNARIPASRHTAVGLAVMNAFPLPNLAEPAQIGRFNWAATGISSTTNHLLSSRVDHSLNPRHRLFGRFSSLKRNQAGIVFFPGPVDFPIDGTLVFSPSFIGSFRYGLSLRVQNSNRGAIGIDGSALKTPDAILRNQSFPGYPVFRLGENMATIGSFLNIESAYQNALLATFTKLKGGHSVKFGVDYRLARWNRRSPGNAGPGEFVFSPVFTQQDPFTNASADVSGTAMASLLLGAPASGSIGFNSPLSMQNHYLAAFAQEDWKVKPRLTLSFGLRYELETPYTERYDRVGYGFDSTARLPLQVPGLDLRGGLLFAGVEGRGRRIGPTDGNNFGPRVGFALSLTDRTVIRGGFGLFYSSQTYNSGFLGEVGAFNSVTPYVGTIDNGATIATTINNPFPNGLQQPVGSSVGLLAQVGNSLSYYDRNRVSPYNEQWQFSIQRELPSQILLDVAYLGMLSLKQFESFDLNEKPDRFLASGTAENNRVPNPFLGVFPGNSTLGQGATIVQRRLWPAYPQYTSLIVQGATTGRAIYHALQAKVDKRLTRGLGVLLTYTRAKLIDNNTTSIVNPRRYRSVSTFDQAQVMRLAFTVELPVRVRGTGWNLAARQVIGGWSLGGFWNVATGVPLSITEANGRPIRIRNPRLSGPISERLGDQRNAARQVLNPYFDVAAFVRLPNQFTVSPEPLHFDELRAPPANTLNLSLFKTIPLRERFRLQLRMDAIAAANTPNFDAPGTNMSNSATFGVINGAGGFRQMLGSARIIF
jgi:hypothetical protein